MRCCPEPFLCLVGLQPKHFQYPKRERLRRVYQAEWGKMESDDGLWMPTPPPSECVDVSDANYLRKQLLKKE